MRFRFIAVLCFRFVCTSVASGCHSANGSAVSKYVAGTTAGSRSTVRRHSTGSAPQQAEQVSGLGDAGEQLEQSDIDSDELSDEDEIAEDAGSAVTQQLPRYGRSLFNQEVSTFAPTDDAPVPDEYRLGCW